MAQSKQDASNGTAPKRLYLLDAMALAYRSHFVFISRPLINSRGENTSATYGFAAAILKLIEDHDIEHLAVVFDSPGESGTYRDELYPEYKANREKMPDELMANLPWIEELVEAMDLPVIKASGVEADDVIGTLAVKGEEQGAEVVIVSADKDFRQLLTPSISIFRPAHRGETFDTMTDDGFRETYGLEPVQFIDMLALMGDASDNVPGVPGIGEKTAMKLLAEHGSVERLIEVADSLKGKRAREGMQNHAEDALMSKKLVTIMTDLDVDIDWDGFKIGTGDDEKLREVFDRLEFKTLYERAVLGKKQRSEPDLFSTADPSTAFDFGPYEPVTRIDEDATDYSTITRKEQLPELAQTLKSQERFALDTETTSTDAMMASLVGLSFSWKDKQAVYVPTPLPDGTQTEEILEALAPAFGCAALKVGQNLKYDLTVLGRHGADVNGPFFDTLVAHYLHAPEEEHNLDAIARTFLSYRMVPITDLIGKKGKDQKSMRDLPIEEVAPYACEDADITLRLYPLLQEKLEEANLVEIARDIEFPLVPVLTAMEREGISIDAQRLAKISQQLGEQLGKLETQIYEAAGESFTIGSPAQLGVILFEKLELRVVSKTSKGKPSTKESVLHELATEHPLPGMILDWRKLSKLKSTYVDSLADLRHPEDNRVHTSFNQTVTSTGRLSSSGPNLQNIPVRTEQGREIRKAFVPREGWTLMAADYVQIELRILAHLSGDKALVEAFATGQDIHTAAAALVYNVDQSEVTRDQRRKAKEVNYGIPYGVSGWGLAQRLRSSIQEAQELIDQYTRSYPGVMRFLNTLVEKARATGYAETMLGRRRYIPTINARNRNERNFAERVAVNMPIQGTQADMIKRAMVAIHDRLEESDLQAKLLLQVHDELVLECSPEEADALAQIVREEMVAALPLGDVPVTVDVNTGPTWLDAH